MSTPGISTRFTIGGLATGLDTSSLLEGLLAVERIPLQRLQSQRSAIEKERGLVQELNKLLLDVRNAALALDNQNSAQTGPAVSEEFLAYQAETSDDAFVTASVTGDAAPGTYTVRVGSLATVARDISNPFADVTTAFGGSGDTFSISYGAGQTIDVPVGAGGITLADLKAAINASPQNDGGVRADVLFDGTAYRLIVAGTQEGVANDIALSTTLTAAGQPFVDAALSNDATDASLTVLGVPITRSSNTFSDAIPGVSLDLRAAQATGEPTTTITVTRDDDAIADRVQELVDAVNALRSFANAQRELDPETNRGGPLNGSPLLRSGVATVFDTLVKQYTFASGSNVDSLAIIGVRSGEGGLLSLDRAALEQKLDANPLHVRELLAGDGTTAGVATALATALEPITRTGDGVFATRDDAYEDRIAILDRSIENLEARLEVREEVLIRQFTALESSVARLQNQSSFLGGL